MRIFSWTVPLVAALAASLPCRGQCVPTWEPGDGYAGFGTLETNSSNPAYCTAMTSWDPDGPGPLPPLLLAAGWIPVAGSVATNGLAAWDGSAWSAFSTATPFPDGVWTPGGPMLTYGGSLIAAGQFMSQAPPYFYCVSRWNGAVWQPLGAGPHTGVEALIEYQGTLVAAGTFSEFQPRELHNIAQWNGTEWLPIGPALALQGTVHALCEHNGRLVAAGSFTAPGLGEVGNIAAWDGQQWQALGAGMNGAISSLLSAGGSLYAGGSFTSADGLPAANIARWDGAHWQPLGDGADGEVRALAPFGGRIVAAGLFVHAGGAAANSIAAWDGTVWSPLGPGVTDGYVNTLHIHNQALVAGGTFRRAGNTVCRRIAAWNGAEWSSFGTGEAGVVTALASTRDGIAAARSDGDSTVAIREHGAWAQLGGRFSGGVNALLDDDSGLIAAGNFISIDGRPTRSIAQWDGASWQQMGDGLYGLASCLTRFNGDVIAGGYFQTSGSRSVGFVARWDGSAWQQVGTGIMHGVNALVAWSGTLYAGGGALFSGSPNIYTARLASDGTWQPLGQSLGHIVYALCIYDDALVAGGYFFSNSTNAHYVARFDGALWQPFGSASANGFTQRVSALTVSGPDLIAAGDFQSGNFPQSPLAHIARWDGVAWRSLGEGLDASVGALLADRGTLYVGGGFTHAGGQLSPYLARWSCPCYADCDGSGSLSVLDFMCFLNQFAAGRSLPAVQQGSDYANCDGSAGTPALNPRDFLCYMERFAAGCP